MCQQTTNKAGQENPACEKKGGSQSLLRHTMRMIVMMFVIVMIIMTCMIMFMCMISIMIMTVVRIIRELELGKR